MSFFNGIRLRKARQYRGWTVEELANRIEVTKQAISQYETGRIIPSIDKILEFSRLLKFPYKFFLQDDYKNLQIGTTYFRSLQRTTKKCRVEQIIRMEHVSQLYSMLAHYVGFPTLNLPDFRLFDNPKKAALSLREHWGLGNGPINNLISRVEMHGIVVTTFPTSTDDIDAFSQFFKLGDDELYIIGLSSNKKSSARLHFDIAHELGHILLHEWSEDIESLSRLQFNEKEKEAHRFAAEFLMPEESFYQEIPIQYATSLDYYKVLKKKWKVSIAAMVYRARELKIISENQYQYLMRSMQKRGWRKIEPLDHTLVTASPSLFRDAVALLLDNKIFSPKELVDYFEISGLSMYPKELEILLNLEEDTLSEKADNSFKIVTLKPSS